MRPTRRTFCILHCALCIAIAATRAAIADTCTWISGSTGGWADLDSWEGHVAPDSTSTVIVPDGVDLPVNDADAALASAVAAVTLGTGSRIVFNLDSTDCSMSGTITGSGTIVKNGAATLNLLNETVNGYWTTGGMQVNVGTLVCPQTFPVNYNSALMNVGPVYVAEGATFTPYARYRTTVITSLSGKGKVAQTLSGGYWPLRITGTSAFEGEMAGPIILSIYGKVDLLGTENHFYANKNLSLDTGADLGVAKFGNRNDSGSSLHRWYTSGGVRYFKDLSFSKTSRMRYLGTGETTDRHFRIGGKVNATMDAGATGDLHLNGRFYKDEAGQAVLTLAGSNTGAASFSGAFDEFDGNSTYIAKTGTGTWTLYGTSTRLNRGVVGVEEGTLQFDTFTETNIPCSFGLSTLLAQKYTGDWDAAKAADYAILLGSADTEGTLEYIGTNLWDNAASTRPVAVTGRGGRVVSSVAGRRIGLKGVFAADAGGGTLTLDGDGTTNYLYNAADGHGTLSLAKEGTGTWVLAGNQTFGGKLDVKGGEVIVSSTLGTKYSWYRFTIKRNYGTASGDPGGDPQTRMYELALYDVEGNRVNLNLADCAINAIPAAGQACYWACKTFTGTVSHLFDNAAKWASGNPYLWATKPVPNLDNPSSWIRIVMHLDASKAEAAYYDICSCNANTHFWEPNAWTMEASADGVFWDTVANVASNETVYLNTHWISDDTDFKADAKRIPSGADFAFSLDTGKSLLAAAPTQLANAKVSVANGAILRADGDVTISSVEVDLGNAAGTIDGFAFAPGGTLSVVNDAAPLSEVILPVNIENATGTQNFSGWNVTVNGRQSASRLLYSDGHLKLVPLGMRIIVQ